MQHDGPMTLCPDEIDEGRWLSLAELRQQMAEQPEQFTSSLRLIWRRMNSQ
jgi:isopentenyldiphosphate isomerase